MATGMSARRDDAWQSRTSALPSTRVDLSWIAGRIEQWVRFGCITAIEETRHSMRAVGFRPGATFAVVRGQASDMGAVHSSILIATALPFSPPPSSSLAIEPINMRIPNAFRFTGISRSSLYLPLLAHGHSMISDCSSCGSPCQPNTIEHRSA